MTCTWRMFAVADSMGRFWNGSWTEPFSQTRAPHLWRRRYDAQYRLNELGPKNWRSIRFSYPLKVVEVQVTA